jgi:hypothetical protein
MKHVDMARQLSSKPMRLSILVISAFLTACHSSSVPPERAQRDPTAEPSYSQAVAELTAINRKARDLFQSGRSDDAAVLVQKGEALNNRLLSVPKPTLAATEAASDLDQLYGQMLFSNRNYGWARLLFQKNLARWKHWKPQTPETASRLEQAEAAIAECDRRMSE